MRKYAKMNIPMVRQPLYSLLPIPVAENQNPAHVIWSLLKYSTDWDESTKCSVSSRLPTLFLVLEM